MEPRIPKETAPFDADNRWTRTWIMYFESLFTLSVKEAVRQAGTVTHTSGDLTKDLPVFGNDKDDVKVGTKSGNTNEVATVTGAVVTGNTVKWDANGNLIDAGTAPGGGSGTVTHTGGALTADQPVFGAGSADIKVGTKTGNTNKVVTNTGTNVTGNTVKWDASGNLIDAGVTPGGGTGGTPAYISSLIAGPDTTKTITGVTHGYATAGLLVQVYDNASPRNAIAAGWTVNSSTFDVIVTFASAQSNYYIVINGATGPAGPTGPPGSGTGTVTSVALTVPVEFSVSGSPVTTSGTLAVSKATQSANTVYAGPTTGSAAAPTFRAVDPADLPLASSSAFGAVKVDGTTITASAGVISAAGSGPTTYTDRTSTRAFGTVYQNTGTRPIFASVWGHTNIADQLAASVGTPNPPTVIVNIQNFANAGNNSVFFIVLPNYFYKVAFLGAGTTTLLGWHEWS